MVLVVDEPFGRRFPVAGVAMLVGYIYPLDVVGIGFHLPHDIHPQADRSGMALGAIARQAESGMFRNRLAAFVATVAALLARMAVGKTVLVAGGADPAVVVAVSRDTGEMLAVGGMADVADTVYRFLTRLLDIIGPRKFVGKNDGCLFPRNRFAEPAVRFEGDLLLDHVDVAVAVRIVAIPAELAPFPGAGIGGIGAENR